ncbi:xylose ABC transporter [Bifidobacterium sp. DSM 109958]|uniref:Xylose ABC transporter n=2 Tax=Bifidobacterium moraviense TaxID=2675323 RepID=A0A7Y0HX16_9BIFI|nr:xylose ABC transporter [Bifidobacterium sp. DSM 109958]
MSMALGACASVPPTVTASPVGTDATGTAASVGSVALFTPSDGITLSQNTPLNKWAALTKDIQQSLKDRAAQAGVPYDSSAVKVTASSDLAAQSQAVQDYVVGRLSESSASSSPAAGAAGDVASTTLVVAPVTNPDAVTRQYGDYVRQDLTWDDATSGSDGATASASASASATASASSDDATREAGERLVSALRLAKDSGMHVVLVSGHVQGFTPDLFVQFGTAELIGRIQAEQLVRKLELDTTSKDNPKYIEVMIPFVATRKDGSAVDAAFVSEAFRGIWDVLGPYFADGRAVSPSRYLSSASTADDWRAVVFDPSRTDGGRDEIIQRLGMKDGGSHPRIDGVLAMNDAVAAKVVSALDDLGYTGSSADINPEITISGIVGSLTGKVDVQRGKVPDPRVAPTESPDDSEGLHLPFIQGTSDDVSWPIVTGYGAYVDTIPQIVNGKQWMTALGNRKDTASALAEAVMTMNAGGDVTRLDGVAESDYADGKVPTIAKDQLAVSASNLKSMLIDTGYVTAADAGL